MPKTNIILFIALVFLCSVSVTFLFHSKISNLETELERTSLMNFDSQAQKVNLKKEFRERVERVQNICKKYHLGKYSYPNRTNDLYIKDSPSPQYSYFYVNKNIKLAWCPVYKAGSTSWLHNMMILAGFSEKVISNPPKQLSFWARDVYGEGEPGLIFDKSVKLVIVRHPFTRLVSAYRDKLSNASVGLEHGTAHFYEKYGRKVVANFRSKTSRVTQNEPTFEEFVNYILKTDFVYYDDHWLPVFYACTPCRVNFDYIAHTETFQRDQAFIIDNEHLGAFVKPKWKHKHKTDERNKGDVHHYFSQLTKFQVRGLYEKYRIDFELFNYKFEEYLEYARE